MNHLQTGNIIVSPTSVATVLALLQQGTSGEAQDQITKTLQMTPELTAPTYKRLTYDMKVSHNLNSSGFYYFYTKSVVVNGKFYFIVEK